MINDFIYERKVYLLTKDGVTKYLGTTAYTLGGNNTIEKLIESLKEVHKDNYPDFQDLWLDKL